MLEKAICDKCGQEVRRRDTNIVFIKGAPVRLCMACYYQELASIASSEICEAMGRKPKDDDIAATVQKEDRDEGKQEG